MSEWINKQALLKQIDIDSDGSPGWYGDEWKFMDTINNMPVRSDLIRSWIPVTERLPEESERDYLATYNWTGPSGRVYTEVEIVEFRRGRWMIGEENRVAAWCPLPEPYQEVPND